MEIEPTAGALRAARKIVPVLKLESQSANAGYESIFAEIIDKETGLPEILEALGRLVEAYSSVPDRHIGCHLAHQCDKARALLLAAQKEKQ